MFETLGDTIERLRVALRDYIEAAYHISDPRLVRQRQALLDEPGVIHQIPYLETTPRYRKGPPFAAIGGLDDAAKQVLALLSSTEGGQSPLVHDPPYQHQADVISHALVRGKSVLVMTGTGSGKTECFLLPILGRLAREAMHRPTVFQGQPATRAMVLYPMNALVNDQLGRLRRLFGDTRLVDLFKHWAGRPIRFARYTSRTPYPGVRDKDKDQRLLAPIRSFFIRHELAARDDSPENARQAASARQLVDELHRRGKWPAKPDLPSWYGKDGAHWIVAGSFNRCVMLPDDSELLTRHEVLECTPDILVTNYSMLEYMLMRPLERPIFDSTSGWLSDNPEESFLLVLDEAHLYRGAQGTEVALLVRRLRARLGIPPERLQVICTSASFADAGCATRFVAQLTGKREEDFECVRGDPDLLEPEAPGTQSDADLLSGLDMETFKSAESDQAKIDSISPFLDARGVTATEELGVALYSALSDYPPMARLANTTMKSAWPLHELAGEVFPNVDERVARGALTALASLGALARPEPDRPSLLPARVHSFYRGLPGLWCCMDPNCTELDQNLRGGPVGRLHAQPVERCGCGAPVLEFYTCRNCGAAYARAYTDNIEDPDYLWPQAWSRYSESDGEVLLEPLDLLLVEPGDREGVQPAEYDLVTGRLDPQRIAGRRRPPVYLPKKRAHPKQAGPEAAETRAQPRGPGQFVPCAVCKKKGRGGSSSVQDHQTKGDQPFQALVTEQLLVQPPSPKPATRFAPLRGRKVLVFSDSRQTAARLAPNLQRYSAQDALRPLMVYGYRQLQGVKELERVLSLEDLFFALLVAAHVLEVRLRPRLKDGEVFDAGERVADALNSGALADGDRMRDLLDDVRLASPPEALLAGMYECLSHPYYGLPQLAIASVAERTAMRREIAQLPDIPGVAESPSTKLELARTWFACWSDNGFWLSRMPEGWRGRDVRTHDSGSFRDMERVLGDKATRAAFAKGWLDPLLKWFAEQVDDGFRLKGSQLSLFIGGDWVRCPVCTGVQRPLSNRLVCSVCGHVGLDPLDPDADPVFVARKGYYRRRTVDVMGDSPSPPFALLAAEHTAQLNAAQAGELFSRAEEYEMLFQDVDLDAAEARTTRYAIDVLSCTTTMEVGIDIGTLSGVALRNLPPARSNYQQRSGRAGRRGTAVATVVALGSADSHDEHYFSEPEEMIRGDVADPALTLSNSDIARRHVTAYLLQRYHRDRLPAVRTDEQPSLFAVLGTVADFRGNSALLHRDDLAAWLEQSEETLRSETLSWLPEELSPEDKEELLGHLAQRTMEEIDRALWAGSTGRREPDEASGQPELQPETGVELPAEDPGQEYLLNRLLYHGVLPRYAFPTDVVSFYVFDPASNPRHQEFLYTPQQGLSVALNQYAPGKQVWIDGQLFTSGALYSPVAGEREMSWETRCLYYECGRCHYAMSRRHGEGTIGAVEDCPACGGPGTFGPARFRIRPPGFAHPADISPGTSLDDGPLPSYATSAKLEAPTPGETDGWTAVNERIREVHLRKHLMVTNRGPRQEGYTLCLGCGRIEPGHREPDRKPALPGHHSKPYPDPGSRTCTGRSVVDGVVLGTEFITDILLIGIRVSEPTVLDFSTQATHIALRTVGEALVKAACWHLELEQGEIATHYRPAVRPDANHDLEAEIYLYDTLPGGAGFSRRAVDLGRQLFDTALAMLSKCTCDPSCYKCLRSFRNKFEHDMLDRHIGASLLGAILQGDEPQFDKKRLETAADVLHHCLLTQDIADLSFERHSVLDVPGIGAVEIPILARSLRSDDVRAIGIHGPLAPDYAADETLRALKEVSPVPVWLADELMIRRNLPLATKRAMEWMEVG